MLVKYSKTGGFTIGEDTPIVQMSDKNFVALSTIIYNNTTATANIGLKIDSTQIAEFDIASKDSIIFDAKFVIPKNSAFIINSNQVNVNVVVSGDES